MSPDLELKYVSIPRGVLRGFQGGECRAEVVLGGQGCPFQYPEGC